MGNTPTILSASQLLSKPSSASSIAESACPVDPAARQAYLDAAAAASSSARQTSDSNSPIYPRPSTFVYGVPTSFPSTYFSQQDQQAQQREPQKRKSRPTPHLGEDRVTSSLPRAHPSPPTTTPSPTSSPSPNAQTPSPSTSNSGNWIYPSEKMFYDAMTRKSHNPAASDMAAVVPIHNAVNERAWSLIKEWEGRYSGDDNERCGGPKLRSFSGDSGKLSPRARWLGLWGYERPFDRHDWVVERCPTTEGGDGGQAVEYLIDFYRGRESERGGGKVGGLNFYLDVRPKLNSWEGVRMRVRRFCGL